MAAIIARGTARVALFRKRPGLELRKGRRLTPWYPISRRTGYVDVQAPPMSVGGESSIMWEIDCNGGRFNTIGHEVLNEAPAAMFATWTPKVRVFALRDTNRQHRLLLARMRRKHRPELVATA